MHEKLNVLKMCITLIKSKNSEILKNKNKIFTILPASTLLCFHIKELFYKNKIPASFHIFTEFYDI